MDGVCAICCARNVERCSVHSGNLMLPLLAGGGSGSGSTSAATWTDYGFVSYKVAAAVTGRAAHNPHKRWIAPEQLQALKCFKALKTGQQLNPFKPSPSPMAAIPISGAHLPPPLPFPPIL